MAGNGARSIQSLLKETLRSLEIHFRGRNGNPAVLPLLRSLSRDPQGVRPVRVELELWQPQGDMTPYADYIRNITRDQPGESPDEVEKKRKLLEGFAFYVDAMVQKKQLLSSFGGDSVRGITARQRNENTAERVGLHPASLKTRHSHLSLLWEMGHCEDEKDLTSTGDARVGACAGLKLPANNWKEADRADAEAASRLLAGNRVKR